MDEVAILSTSVDITWIYYWNTVDAIIKFSIEVKNVDVIGIYNLQTKWKKMIFQFWIHLFTSAWPQKDEIAWIE